MNDVRWFKLWYIALGSCLFSSLYSVEPLGVPDREEIEYPEDEPPSELEIQLGKVLFFDPRLSGNQKMSCATCHNPDLGFSDGQKKGLGSKSNRLARKTPHVNNLAWSNVFFWDGRANSLEEQALMPITSGDEMDMDLDQLVERLKKVSWYVGTFKRVYDDEVTKENIAKALASYQRNLIVDDTPFDKYMKGELSALSPNQKRGMNLFMSKARCFVCHSGPNFSDDSFHNIGLADASDLGRYKFVKDDSLKGAFKTPGLRNVALRAPYMHDGSEPTLEEVIRLYNMGGRNKENLSQEIKPLGLSEQEIADLVAFLGALTGPVDTSRPQIPE